MCYIDTSHLQFFSRYFHWHTFSHIVHFKISFLPHLPTVDSCLILCVCAQSLSHIQLSVTPCTVAHQPLLSMRFSRQEHWSGLPFPPPGNLPWPRDQTYISYASCIDRRVLYLLSYLGNLLTNQIKFTYFRFLFPSSSPGVIYFSSEVSKTYFSVSYGMWQSLFFNNYFVSLLHYKLRKER